MHVILILLAALLVTVVCAYFRTRLWVWTLATAFAIVVAGFALHAVGATEIVLAVFAVLFALPLNERPLRRALRSAP